MTVMVARGCGRIARRAAGLRGGRTAPHGRRRVQRHAPLQQRTPTLTPPPHPPQQQAENDELSHKLTEAEREARLQKSAANKVRPSAGGRRASSAAVRDRPFAASAAPPAPVDNASAARPTHTPETRPTPPPPALQARAQSQVQQIEKKQMEREARDAKKQAELANQEVRTHAGRRRPPPPPPSPLVGPTLPTVAHCAAHTCSRAHASTQRQVDNVVFEVVVGMSLDADPAQKPDGVVQQVRPLAPTHRLSLLA